MKKFSLRVQVNVWPSDPSKDMSYFGSEGLKFESVIHPLRDLSFDRIAGILKRFDDLAEQIEKENN